MDRDTSPTPDPAGRNTGATPAVDAGPSAPDIGAWIRRHSARLTALAAASAAVGLIAALALTGSDPEPDPDNDAAGPTSAVPAPSTTEPATGTTVQPPATTTTTTTTVAPATTTTTTTTVAPATTILDDPANTSNGIVPSGWRPGVSPDAARTRYFLSGTPSPTIVDPGGPLPEGMFVAERRWPIPDPAVLDLDLHAFTACVEDDPRMDECWDRSLPFAAPIDRGGPVGRTTVVLDETVRVNLVGDCATATGNGTDLVALFGAFAADWAVLLAAGYDPFDWEVRWEFPLPSDGLLGEFGRGDDDCPGGGFDGLLVWRHAGSPWLQPESFWRVDRPTAEWLPTVSLIEVVNGETIVHVYGGFIS